MSRRGNARLFRRLRRFSLRTALVLLTVFCVVLGTEVNAYRAQRRCVAALESRDTEGKFWHRSPRFTLPTIVKQRVPWVASLVSQHVQYRVTHVDLAQHYGEAVDRVLEGTAVTGSLVEATLNDIEWTESRLRDLARQKQLADLTLNGATTDDRAVAAVSKLRSLERLSFNCSHVSRDGMLKLMRLKNLSRLALRGVLDETTMYDLKEGLPNAYITLR